MLLENHITNVKLDCLVPILGKICKKCFSNEQVMKTLTPHIEHVIKEGVKWTLRSNISNHYVELDVHWPEAEESWVIMS